MKLKYGRWIFLIFIISSFGFYSHNEEKTDYNFRGSKSFMPFTANNQLSLWRQIATNKQDTSADKGIGPIKDVKLGSIDPKLVSEGHNLYNSKCMICHSLDTKKIGPPLGDITKKRTPEFIMNLLLNTGNMEREDPIMKDLISQYHIPMTPPGISQQQARAILEYLRSVKK
jgi:cytochrome c